MLHDIGVALQAKLRERECPIPVIDGPESTKTATWGRERIVLEHSDGDRFGPSKGVHVNPPHRFIRSVAAKLTIYAQRTRSGALEFEHRDRAEAILDSVLVALGDVAGVTSPMPVYNVFTPTGGRFIAPTDLDGAEVRGGAVYELDVTFERAVKVQTFAGAIAEEATVGGEDGVGVVNTVIASIDGEDFETVIPSEA
jgi:hypothetical protein